MAGLVQFNFEGLNVRVQDKDGNPWFILADVCRVLDVKNVSDASRRLDADERGIVTTDTPSGTQEMLIVNESGLYSLVLTSRKPEAKRFKKFVTAEVLPSIRKTGSYSVNLAPQATSAAVIDLRDPVQMAKVALQLVEINRELETRIAEAEPKAAVYDQIANAEGHFTFTKAAKILQIPRGEFIARLEGKFPGQPRSLGVTRTGKPASFCYRDSSGTLLPYSDFEKAGLFVVKFSPYEAHSQQKVSAHTYVTPKGIEYFASRLQKKDPHPKLRAELAARKALPAPTQRNLI